MSLVPSIVRTTKLGSSDVPRGEIAHSTTPSDITKIKNLHHHAFISTDSERSRVFCEDILGLTLTQTVILDDDIEFFKGKYCHTFYALADGSSIAFFEYPALWEERMPPQLNRFEHHLALQVESDEALEFFSERLKAHGIKSMLVDHHVYKSLAFDGPDGLNFELLAETPATAGYEAEAKQTAHQQLRDWTASQKVKPMAAEVSA